MLDFTEELYIVTLSWVNMNNYEKHTACFVCYKQCKQICKWKLFGKVSGEYDDTAVSFLRAVSALHICFSSHLHKEQRNNTTTDISGGKKHIISNESKPWLERSSDYSSELESVL